MISLMTAAALAIPIAALIGAARAAAFSSEPIAIVGTYDHLAGTSIWYNRSVGLSGQERNDRSTAVTVCFHGDNSIGGQIAEQCRYVAEGRSRGFSFSLSPDAPRAIDAVYVTVNGGLFGVGLYRPGFTPGPTFTPTY